MGLALSNSTSFSPAHTKSLGPSVILQVAVVSSIGKECATSFKSFSSLTSSWKARSQLKLDSSTGIAAAAGAKDAGVPYILSKRFKNVRHSGARVGSVKNSWRIGGGTVRLLSETTQMARVGITAGIGLSASGGFGTYRGSCCPMIPDPFFQSCTSEN